MRNMRTIIAAACVVFVAAAPVEQRHQIPCGLPPHLEELPAEARQKIVEIWENYKEGNNCYEEHGLTREVIQSLPRDQHKELFMKGVHLPMFMKKATPEVRDQFLAIFRDGKIPFADKPEKLRMLAEQLLTGELLQDFMRFHEQLEQHRADSQAKIARLSPKALDAYNQMEELEQQKREIFHSLSDDVRYELLHFYHGHTLPDGPHFQK